MKSILKCKRISIVGPSGSGKSTLAKKLGELLNLPAHHIDCYFWKIDWVQAGDSEIDKKIETIAEEKEWILDGYYRRTLEIRFRQSDLIIFLNFPIDTCIQYIKNRIGQKDRVGLPDYLSESDESIEELIAHLKKYPESIKSYLLPLIDKYKEKVIVLESREQVNEFIRKLETEKRHNKKPEE